MCQVDRGENNRITPSRKRESVREEIDQLIISLGINYGAARIGLQGSTHSITEHSITESESITSRKNWHKITRISELHKRSWHNAVLHKKLAQCCVAQKKLAQCCVAQKKLAQCCVAQKKLAQCCVAQKKLAQCCVAQKKLAQCCVAQKKLAQCCVCFNNKRGSESVSMRYHGARVGRGAEKKFLA